MRDIKFRAWDRINKKYLDIELLSINSKGNIVCVIDNNENHYSLEQVELMQYTGLKDKNGKMIFEGDIVRDTVYGWTETVEIKVQSDGCWLFSGYHSYISEEKQLEVIGNIYENKELLEGGDKK